MTQDQPNFAILGLVLAALGMVYLIKPDIFRRWFWKRTSLMQRLLKPQHYLIYMRVLGILYVAIGLALFLYGRAHP